MTEKTQPTDAEILDAADDFRSQYNHGGTTFDEFDALSFARAVLAKWGTPQPTQAQAAESVPANLLAVALAYKEYIDAIPNDIAAALPAMPGVDGDWAAEVLGRASRAPADSEVQTSKFRYLICSIFDDAPTGTNNRELADYIAGLAQDWFVVDALAGVFLPPFEEGAAVEEEDPNNWAE